jgi:hypothetical protein
MFRVRFRPFLSIKPDYEPLEGNSLFLVRHSWKKKELKHE